jgi:hypothetical protein
MTNIDICERIKDICTMAGVPVEYAKPDWHYTQVPRLGEDCRAFFQIDNKGRLYVAVDHEDPAVRSLVENAYQLVTSSVTSFTIIEPEPPHVPSADARSRTDGGLSLLLSDQWGSEMPRGFVTQIDLRTFWGIRPTDVAICSQPDHPHVWDAWQDIVDRAIHRVNIDGQTYDFYLYENGNLWLACNKLLTAEERRSLYDDCATSEYDEEDA